MSRIATRVGMALVVIALLGGCGEDSDPTSVPSPGQVIVTLSTPHQDDGAALVRVTGPGFTTARPVSASSDVFWRLTASGELRAIVIGGLASGPILTVDVPDTSRSGAYTATLLEVAATDDLLRADLSGYAISVERASE